LDLESFTTAYNYIRRYAEDVIEAQEEKGKAEEIIPQAQSIEADA